MNKPSILGEVLAEFIGTTILITIGVGVVAMVELFGTGVPGEVTKGGYTNITLAWGRDYDDVSPIKGVILGGGRHSISVGVDVTPVEGS